jgi:hypothetical protein
MKDAAPDCNGILLRGSQMIESKALTLLADY